MSSRGGQDSPGPAPQSSTLIELVEKQGLELFHDGAGEAFAALQGGQTWSLPSRAFGTWLRGLLFAQGARAIARDATVREVVQLLEARALYGSACRQVFVRVARVGDVVYVDLGDASWRVVEISQDGWRVVPAGASLARFRRPGAMLPLPEPARGGHLSELRSHLNLEEDDGQWSLVAAFLVASIALAPRGPFPVLILHGEQGSMKTTCTEHCAALVDPRRAGLRAMPHDLENLAVAAHNGFLMAFDNVSTIEPAMSDGLCRIATGAGFAKRTHYENRDETIFDAARPMILNGIGQPVTRPDLMDRAVAVELPHLAEGQRRTKREVAARFEAARPRLLAGLFDAVSLVLRDGPATGLRLTELPRMADFAVAGAAAEAAMRVAPGTFLRAFAEARRSGAETAGNSDPIALALSVLLERRRSWEGSASELLARLERPPGVPRHAWPSNATALGSRLVRLRPALPALGIEAVQRARSGEKGRRWLIQRSDVERAGAASTVMTGGAARGDTEAALKNGSQYERLGASDASDTSPRATDGRAEAAGAAGAPSRPGRAPTLEPTPGPGQPIEARRASELPSRKEGQCP